MRKSIIQRLSLVLSDGLSLYVSLILTFYTLSPGYGYVDLNRLGLAKTFGFFILAVFWQQEHYTKRRPTWEEIKLLYITIFVFAVIHFNVIYMSAHHITKSVNVIFWLFLLIVLPFFRYITKNVLLKFHLWQRKVYIVGHGKNASATYHLLQDNYLLGYEVIGFVNINDCTLSLNPTNFLGIPLYSYNDLLKDASINEVEIIFALEAEELNLNISKVDILQTKFTFVSFVPDVVGLPLYGASLDHFFGSNQIILRLKNNLSRRINRIIKRLSDIIFAIVGILLLSPLFLLFAVLIKLSGNKIFYKHKRLGRRGNYFYCIKFKTMYDNSQETLEVLLATNRDARMEWEKDFKLRDDPRITKIGKFLRKTSLDEIPQLLNVLKGEMSLVGPRPIIEIESKKYGEDFYYYQLVRPGITGLWQISGRNDIDYTNRVALDVWYVKNWSLWYDFVIIFRTIIVILGRKGAY